MKYTQYGNWDIYETGDPAFPFTFSHKEFATNRLQGGAFTLEEAKAKADKLETKS